MYHFFLLHSSVDGHLSIHILVAWTNVAVNMGVQIPFKKVELLSKAFGQLKIFIDSNSSHEERYGQ